MLLPQDARHHIDFAWTILVDVLAVYILVRDQNSNVVTSNDILFLPIYLYNYIRLVTPTPSIGTVSAVTL